MPCGWEGNHRSVVALAMRHRHQWFIHLRAQGLRKADEHPAYIPCGVWHALHTHTHARMHAHTFNGPLSGTTRVSQYQKGKTKLDFTEARDNECQWHQLGHMQVCTSLHTDNHASTPPLSDDCC